jgi:EAL domain-containing protein (putative c-di-GMP-specific phosphodiesterase class I)
VGVEALVRWRSPELGLIPPLDFIPLLEETGLIMPVGQWILESACQQGVNWQQQGIPLLKVNVNVSAVQFLQKGIIHQVSSAIELSGLKPQLLDLEITESLLINDTANSLKTLDALNELGVALSVDDFGTGYSSLSYLKRIPIETLKIDKSFIRDIAIDTDDAAIVDAICSLSRSLRLNVIAEGVETHEQLGLLRNLGVGTVQGYLLSRPLPATELTEILRKGDLLDFKESVA